MSSTNDNNTKHNTATKGATDAKTVQKDAALAAKKTPTAKASSGKTSSKSGSPEKSSKEEKRDVVEIQRDKQKKRSEVNDEIVLIITGLICILLYLSLLNCCGLIGRGINCVLFGFMGGIVPYFFPVAMFIIVWFMLKYPDSPVAIRKTTVFLISQFIITAVIHLFSDVVDEKFFRSFTVGYREKRGGGLFGAILGKPLYLLFDKVASLIILFALLLVCIILIIGKGVFKELKEYIIRKREERQEAYDEEYDDNHTVTIGQTPNPGSQSFTLEDIQEENRKRRVMLVDAEPPAIPVDLSFYADPAKKKPEKKQGFLDKLLNRKEEKPKEPTYTANYTVSAVPVDGISKTAENTVKEPVPLNGAQTRPDGNGSKVTTTGHPFYQLELDNKFRETGANESGSILKTGYDEPDNAYRPEESEREINRRRAVWQKLDEPAGNTVSGTPSAAGTEPNITINGISTTADVAKDIAGVNPYDAVETTEAVAPSRSELIHAGAAAKNENASDSAPKAGTAAANGAAQNKSNTNDANAVSDDLNTLMEQETVPVREYKFPPLHLLNKPKNNAGETSGAELKETARKLEQTLKSFGVNVTITEISCGPSVTRYELQPEQGVKVSKITNLENDIKLNLAAEDIRIEAPIPGKAAVGIEVPNKVSSGVMLRTLLESQEFRDNKGKITFAVGKDIGGNIVLSDISKMPHLLIAGATGSGKSVCINTMVISLLYKYKPEDLKIMMIDPKVVELSVYNGIPHLAIPVITDPKKASNALNWAVMEMTRRYELFAEFGVRNLEGFNEKLESSTEPLTDKLGNKLTKLPRFVIIVDELADLMMVAPGEVEDAICRLAQLARAAGIHLVIATQRPSVDVITGLIKANIPSRIAFAVSSGIDSRTILDQVGAEKLLGKGDMLFFPQGIPKPVRLQGPFVSDEEIQSIVDFLVANNGAANINNSIHESIENGVSPVSEQMKNGSSSAPENDRDEYFADAGRFIIEKEKASIGMLQRVYKIGFNRAARIMDQLAEAGVVGPEEGTKPRKILMTAQEFENFLSEQ